jgi:ribosomal protein L11 methyltransferase
MSGSQRPPKTWIEVRATVPVAAREAVIGWMSGRDAIGVQEDWPGIGELGDGGPVVSGDPHDWSGDEIAGPQGEVLVRCWLDPSNDVAEAAEDLRAFLRGIDEWCPGATASRVESARVVEEDWNAMWRSQWKPTPVGRSFLVCPSWKGPAGDSADRVLLRIDPGMAFGTGTHFTTAGCLELLEESLSRRPEGVRTRVLDVGTGTGVLSIAALLSGAAEAVGVDLDPDAVAEARNNAIVNGVADRFSASDDPVGPALGQFHLVLANILAETIVEMAPALVAAIVPGGELVVSGIIHARAESVEAALRSLGLEPVRELRDNAWVAAAWRKPVVG